MCCSIMADLYESDEDVLWKPCLSVTCQHSVESRLHFQVPSWMCQWQPGGDEKEFQLFYVSGVDSWTGGWGPVLFFNSLLVIYYFVFGFCIGGWASIKTLVDKIHVLGLFVDCYQVRHCKEHHIDKAPLGMMMLITM